MRYRLIADVPLGVFLSGGLDSSTIVAIMREVSSDPIKTFSIGFESQSFNELPYARLVARHFETEHHELVVRPDAIDLVPKLVLAPSFLLVLIFVYGFNLWTVFLSFTNSKAFASFTLIGFANYEKLNTG